MNLRYLRLICKARIEIEGKIVSSALSAVPFERVIKVEDWLSVESALSAVPFERVIQVQVYFGIESALSAFGFECCG